jgi:hypothetical protein
MVLLSTFVAVCGSFSFGTCVSIFWVFLKVIVNDPVALLAAFACINCASISKFADHRRNLEPWHR